MMFAVRTYGCVSLAVYLWACLVTGHATLNNLLASFRVALPLALVFLLPLSLVRWLSGRTDGSGGDPLDRELFRFPSGDPFRLRHLMTSLNVWGVIGSGKSSSSGLFFARLLLKLNSSGLVLASNPDDAAWWSRRFAEAGRADDLIVFHKGGKHRWNFLAELQANGADAREITAFLVTASETLIESKGKDDAYWKGISERILFNIITILLLAKTEVSAGSIGNFIGSTAYAFATLETEDYQAGFAAEMLRRAESNAVEEAGAGDFAVAANFWRHDFISLDARPRSSALSMVDNIIHCLNTGYARVLFSTHTTTSCAELVKGKWILLDFPVSAEGPTAKLIYSCAKLAVQKQVLKNYWTPELPITVIWADEAWHVTNRGDRDFLAESRKHGGVLVFLTQSILNYSLAMGGDELAEKRARSFCGMMGTLIVHAADVATAEYMCSLVGEAYQDEIGGSYQPAREADAAVTGPVQWSGSFSRRRSNLMTTRDFTAGMRMGGKGKIVDAWVYRTDGFSTGLNLQRMEFHQD